MEDPHSKIDALLSQREQNNPLPQESATSVVPPTKSMQKVERNLRFTQRMLKNPLKKNVHTEKIFGAIPFDPAVEVYGHNMWDRGIYVVDELCDMYVSGSLEQMKKYLKVKRKVDSKFLFMLILIGMGGLAVTVMLILLTGGV